jgi:uncharacterized membrane protein YdfJ with MMPL/SSD domain
VLRWWGRAVFRVRWLMVAAAMGLVALAVTWGVGVFDRLSSGGFDDPASESVQAADKIAAEFGSRNVDVVALYSSDSTTVDDPAFADAVGATLDEVRQLPEVASVVSWYDTGSANFVSDDRRATYAAVSLRGDTEDAKYDDFEVVEPSLTAPGVSTEIGGLIGFQVAVDEAAERDIMRGEMIALPIVLVLMVFIFRGVVAAAMPLMIGVLAILGAFTVTRLLTGFTDVSTFALNIIILLGLGMAIDYSLLVISRFREELHAGHPPSTAVMRTVATAGRTVLVSGLIIALALFSLLVFPQGFLRSMGFGGMAAVLVAMVGALTVLPAVLGMLGHRINSWRVRLPGRRRAEPVDAVADHGAWARLAHSVMRRPGRYLTAVAVLLAVLSLPILGVQFAGLDNRVLPPGAEVREVSEQLSADFPGVGITQPIETVVTGASPGQVEELVTHIRAVPQVRDAEVSGTSGDVSLITATYPGERAGDAAYDAVRGIRDIPVPEGVEVLVGGRSAGDLDRVASLSDRLPWMGVWMASVIGLVLFLAFGSVLLPIKAVLVNLLSVAASFGVVVWGFQDGNLAGWLNFTTTGFIEPSIPILLLAIVFGLSTDYEVFLLSRVREAWEQTGDSTAAVAIGVQRTGRIITAAALVLSVVVAGFATGEVAFIKMLGIGMIVAVVVDATLVRILLVPATMRLLGRASWWLPGPLARLYRSYGIREKDAEPVETTRPPAPVRS